MAGGSELSAYTTYLCSLSVRVNKLAVAAGTDEQHAWIVQDHTSGVWMVGYPELSVVTSNCMFTLRSLDVSVNKPAAAATAPITSNGELYQVLKPLKCLLTRLCLRLVVGDTRPRLPLALPTSSPCPFTSALTPD